MNNCLRRLLCPKRVAVIGASNTPGKLGFLLMRNLSQAFTGEIYPVNPGQPEIQGYRAYPGVKDTPKPPDLAILATPPGKTPEIIADCVTAKAGVAVILSGGFAEAGAGGGELERELLSTARRGNLRLLGPNCFGVINTMIGLNASLGFGLPRAGGVSLITQSGAYGMAAFSCSQQGDIGFAKVIAPGNKIDIDEVELLRYLRDDPDTQVIAMLLESISHGRALFDEVRETTRSKPVIILKTGRSGSGQRAAMSHTAALANDHAVTAAALKQAGAHLVSDGQTLLDAAAALEKQPPVRGRRAAIITNSGGTGVELTDLLEESGLSVPKLPEPLQRRIRTHLPEHGSPENPIDVTTQWSRFADMYEGTLQLLLDSEEIDVVVLVLLQRSALMPEVAERVIKEVASARLNNNPKPVHVCWVAGLEGDANKRKLLDHGIPVNAWPLRTARAVAACVHRPLPARSGYCGERLPVPENIIPNTWLEADHCYRLVESAGVQTSPWQIAMSREGLIQKIETLAFPMVLKAIRPGIQHKSDVGGLKLGLHTTAEVLTAAEDMESHLGPGPYLLQQQVGQGIELFVGATHDQCFGPTILFGIGGTMVELVNDTSIRLAPVSVDEALDMLNEVRAQKLLDGYRGHPAVHRGELARFISNLSDWVASATWIDQLDINPLIANGGEFVAVDARVHLRDTMS